MQPFVVEQVSLTLLVSKWHFHEENEIIFIPGGRLACFIGDGQFKFSKESLIMIGACTPHIWVWDNEFTSGSDELKEEAIIIKFRESFLGNYFIQFSGVERIKALMEKSKRGIIFTSDKLQPLMNKLESINELDYFDKILLLFESLNLFSKSKTYTLVSNSASLSLNQKREISNIDKILKFIETNFKHKITIKEVAETANLSPTSFCRYFKSRTFKTFITVVNETRIEYASKLLLETNLSVSEICYQSGFNQLSNFYRQFINIKKMTPKHFRKKMLAICLTCFQLVSVSLYDYIPIDSFDLIF